MTLLRRLVARCGRSPARTPRSTVQLRVEALECRQVLSPTVVDPNLAVRTVIADLHMPTSLAFLGDNDLLVLEKETGKVQHVVDGQVVGTAVDLHVNFASERGLLGIVLHPNFANHPFVYLYWTASTSGADTDDLAAVSLLGNRVDRFLWDGTTLTFDRHIISLHAFQADAGQPLRGNHNGGIIRFGPDGKLYIIIGDNGRRGLLQNNRRGPFPDDQFGGPEPDNNHTTGVILRLNDDGTTPDDNPFFAVGAQMGGEVGANIQRLFGYGVRNSFGMAFDPYTGLLWTQENGDDSYDEINRVAPGFNGGWVNIMGPVARVADYKAIETGQIFPAYRGLQQDRWSPDLIADTPEEALANLYVLPGSTYTDPQFSWRFAVAPAGIGFMQGTALGRQYDGNLFVGAARTFLEDGYLFRFQFTPDRHDLAFDDDRLADRVADNTDKYDPTESESLLFGSGFGIGTDIQTGPNGNLYVVSLSDGAIYEIYRKEANGAPGLGAVDVVFALAARDLNRAFTAAPLAPALHPGTRDLAAVNDSPVAPAGERGLEQTPSVHRARPAADGANREGAGWPALDTGDWSGGFPA